MSPEEFSLVDSISESINEARFQIGPEIGRGGNTIVYEVVDRPDLVVRCVGAAWGGATPELVQQMLETSKEMQTALNRLLPEVNTPRILHVWTEGNKLYEIMERVPGIKVHDRDGSFEQWKTELATLAAVPQEHYKKLIADIQTLHEHHFAFDPSKPDNLFYDGQRGFSIIDLNYKSDSIGSLEVPLIDTYFLFTKYRQRLDTEIRQSIEAILQKLEAAGDAKDNPAEYMKSEIARVLAEIKT